MTRSSNIFFLCLWSFLGLALSIAKVAAQSDAKANFLQDYGAYLNQCAPAGASSGPPMTRDCVNEKKSLDARQKTLDMSDNELKKELADHGIQFRAGVGRGTDD